MKRLGIIHSVYNIAISPRVHENEKSVMMGKMRELKNCYSYNRYRNHYYYMIHYLVLSRDQRTEL